MNINGIIVSMSYAFMFISRSGYFIKEEIENIDNN